MINSTNKLWPHFFVTYKIIAQVKSVACHLESSLGAHIQDMFHVSCQEVLLSASSYSAATVASTLWSSHPSAIVQEHGWAHLCHSVHQLLVKWTGQPASAVSSVNLDLLWRPLNDKLHQRHLLCFQVSSVWLSGSGGFLYKKWEISCLGSQLAWMDCNWRPLGEYLVPLSERSRKKHLISSIYYLAFPDPVWLSEQPRLPIELFPFTATSSIPYSGHNHILECGHT